MTFRLYDYWRSSASFRVRIALNLKGLAYEAVHTNLLDGSQRAPDYVARNPQGFVPMLEVGDLRLTQSLAIIDWLDSTQQGPQLIPVDPERRAHALAMAYLIASDIHPINNLRILKYLKKELGHEQAEIDQWARHWITTWPWPPRSGCGASPISSARSTTATTRPRRFMTPRTAPPLRGTLAKGGWGRTTSRTASSGSA